MLLIGTNDLGTTALRTPKGVEAQLQSVAPGVASRIQDAVRLLRDELPRSQVVLLGLLPRGTGSGEGVPVGQGDFRWPSVFTPAIAAINARLR